MLNPVVISPTNFQDAQGYYYKSGGDIMTTFNIGDKVKIKNQPNWPTTPGYRFADAEGTVIASDFDELMGDFLPHMVCVKLEKAGANAKAYVVNTGFWFLTEYVEKR